MKNKNKYPSDLTDQEWEEIRPLFKGMRRRIWSKRELTNAVFYLQKTGCQWRQLPNDFPPYPTVWSFYRRACISGLWDAILQHLVKRTREKAKRSLMPTYGIIDSQTVKTAGKGEAHGIDGGKKIKGRKRHIVVDLMGNLLAVEEDAASFLGIEVEISEKITPNKFHILPKRWVVERTLSWLNNSRRLSKDYETSTNSSENMIKISHSRTLLKRLS